MGNVIIGILIPFLGTTLGSGLVFFMRKKEINKKVQKLLIGFAAGVMMAASIWSLLMPALDMTAGKFAWVPVAVGFMSGIVFLLILDTLVPHQHLETEKAEGLESNFKKTTKLVLALLPSLSYRQSRNKFSPNPSLVVAFRKRAGIIWSVSTFSKGRGTQVLVIILNFVFILCYFIRLVFTSVL